MNNFRSIDKASPKAATKEGPTWLSLFYCQPITVTKRTDFYTVEEQGMLPKAGELVDPPIVGH
jgi:hypothetical protein